MLFGYVCCSMIIFSGITDLKVEPYDEDKGTGELRYVQVINVWMSRLITY